MEGRRHLRGLGLTREILPQKRNRCRNGSKRKRGRSKLPRGEMEQEFSSWRSFKVDSRLLFFLFFLIISNFVLQFAQNPRNFLFQIAQHPLLNVLLQFTQLGFWSVLRLEPIE